MGRITKVKQQDRSQSYKQNHNKITKNGKNG